MCRGYVSSVPSEDENGSIPGFPDRDRDLSEDEHGHDEAGSDEGEPVAVYATGAMTEPPVAEPTTMAPPPSEGPSSSRRQPNRPEAAQPRRTIPNDDGRRNELRKAQKVSAKTKIARTPVTLTIDDIVDFVAEMLVRNEEDSSFHLFLKTLQTYLEPLTPTSPAPAPVGAAPADVVTFMRQFANGKHSRIHAAFFEAYDDGSDKQNTELTYAIPSLRRPRPKSPLVDVPLRPTLLTYPTSQRHRLTFGFLSWMLKDASYSPSTRPPGSIGFWRSHFRLASRNPRPSLANGVPCWTSHGTSPCYVISVTPVAPNEPWRFMSSPCPTTHP